MSGVTWTITAPGGVGSAEFSAVGIENASFAFRQFAASTAALQVHRDIDSVDLWWAPDSVVTIFRNSLPFFTGRVKETPFSGNESGEWRALNLEDGFTDLEEITYREGWGVGASSILMPQAILGVDETGVRISTGKQIEAALDYAISEDALIQRGDIDTGLILWPTEVENLSCAEVIAESMWARPDWVLWLDHSTNPPTVNCQPKAGLNQVIVEVADEDVAEIASGKIERNKPRGISILYRSAAEIDGTVYRDGYFDNAGETSGRKIIRSAIDLEGVKMQFQKTRIQVRPIAANAGDAIAYIKKKWPELADIPDAVFNITKWERKLAAEEALPDPVCSKAERLDVPSASDIPNELVRGSIEDWMRKKVGTITITYDMDVASGGTEAQREILKNFSGKGKTFSVTATNAVTKLYTGITSFTAGEDRPLGLAAAIFAAATVDDYEGEVTIATDEVSAERWIGKNLVIKNNGNTIVPGATIHSAMMDLDSGEVTLQYGPLPYFSAGDYMELIRRMRNRKATWMSAEERASAKLGAEANAGSRGDSVGGFDYPQTQTVPGGGGGGESFVPFQLSVAKDGAAWKWKVSSKGSSITDGTNGLAVDLSAANLDTATAITATKYIVLEADVSAGEATAWTTTAVELVEAKEVGINTSEPPEQNKVRLLVGKITFATAGGETTATASQAVFSNQMLSYGMLNGLEVLILEAAITHPSKL